MRTAGELAIQAAQGLGPLHAVPADAPVFIVLPTVKHSAEMVWRLVAEMRREGASPGFIDELSEAAVAIQLWQEDNPDLVRVPGRR